MPTSPDSDVIPVRRTTKRRLEAIKGERTFDELVRALLDLSDEPPRLPFDRPRAPEEQLALADLAATRWRLACRDGRIREIGPRLVSMRTGTRERRRIRVRPA